MELSVNGAGTISVSDSAFARDYNEALIHQVVNAYLAGARQGSKQQKSRSEVRGGGKKPWRQKGTGRARAGTIRSPIWRGGGVTFAATHRDFSQKVNKKMFRAGMQAILSELIRQQRLLVVEEISISSPKTKLFSSKLKELGVTAGLIIADEVDENLYLASRNIPDVTMCDASAINPLSLVAHDRVVVTVPALRKIEEMLG